MFVTAEKHISPPPRVQCGKAAAARRSEAAGAERTLFSPPPSAADVNESGAYTKSGESALFTNSDASRTSTWLSDCSEVNEELNAPFVRRIPIYFRSFSPLLRREGGERAGESS